MTTYVYKQPSFFDNVKRRKWRILRTVFLLAFATFSIFIPLWIVLINSAKPIGEANELGLSLPREWAIEENYRTVVEEGRMGQGFVNTLIVVVPSVVGIVILGSMAAWVFARAKNRRISLLYYLSIAGVLIPPAIVASIQVLRSFAAFGPQVQLILFYMGVYMSFAIFLVTGFVKTIPIELEEAARIDGASAVTTFFRIIMPMLKPILITASFILLLFMWNDFFYAFFFVGSLEKRTLVLGLFSFISGFYQQIRWNLVFASVVVVSLPLIFVFAFAQRWIVSGLMGTTVDK
jgi:raffinose/stachyose/melibiose transport system permease protein